MQEIYLSRLLSPRGMVSDLAPNETAEDVFSFASDKSVQDIKDCSGKSIILFSSLVIPPKIPFFYSSTLLICNIKEIMWKLKC